MPATVGVTVSLSLFCASVALPPEVLVNAYVRFEEAGLLATAVRVTELPTFTVSGEAVSDTLSATGAAAEYVDHSLLLSQFVTFTQLLVPFVSASCSLVVFQLPR